MWKETDNTDSGVKRQNQLVEKNINYVLVSWYRFNKFNIFFGNLSAKRN